MTYAIDLEKEIHRILQSSSKLRNYNGELRDKYIKQEENFDQERKRWDRDRKKWSKKLGGANTEIQKLRTHDLELINETRRLQIENTRKDISLAESKAKHATKLEEIKSLRNGMKLLKDKLDLSQKDSSKKGSEIESLKSKIVGLALKISELERLKPEDISGSIIGGAEPHDSKSRSKGACFHNKKYAERGTKFYIEFSSRGITPLQSNNISTVSGSNKNLSKYFVHRKNMDPIEKIDGEITELPKNDTEINPKVSDETSISEISEDITSQFQEIKSANPYLTQRGNNSGASAKPHISSLIKSNAQMRPSLEALPLPAVASTLMSPLSAYIFLALLIIAVVWFVRRTWNIGRLEAPLLHRPEGATLKGHKKSDRLRDMWIG